MKIAFVSHINWNYSIDTVYQRPLGGTQSALCYLAEKLANNGHQVFFFNHTSEPTESRNVICIPINQVPQSLIDTLDIMVVTDGSSPGKLWKIRLQQKTLLLFWCQHDIDQDAIATLSDIEEQNIYDGFIFISEWQKQRFIEQFSLDATKTHVLRNAISPHFENLFPENSSILAKKSSHLSLTYTSTPFRGLNILIDVFPEIYQNIPNAELKIFSSMKVYLTDEQEEKRQFGNLYQKCQNTEGVNYIGSIPQPELAQQLKSIHLLAYSNTFAETSCIALMEAMASGCYVITSDYGALPETAHGFAQLISFKDGIDVYKRQFTEKILNYFQKLNSDESQDLENHLRNQVDFVNDNYTWSVRAKEWIECLSNLKDNKLNCLNEKGNNLNLEQNKKINPYLYLGLAYVLGGEIETAESAWMSVLLESESVDDQFDKLLDILDQEAQYQISNQNYNLAITLYGILERFLLEQEEKKSPYAIYYRNMGTFCQLRKLPKLALQYYEQARNNCLSIEDFNDLGAYQMKLKQMEEAMKVYLQQTKVHPNYISGYTNLIFSLCKMGDMEQAKEICLLALKKFPDNLLLKMFHYLMLPSVYESERELKIYRQRFIDGLDKIIEEVDKLDLTNIGVQENVINAFIGYTNFELAYQGLNHKDLQKKYGDLIYKVVSFIYPQWVKPIEKNPVKLSRKIRVGYISDSMNRGVIAYLTLGWLSEHDREKFEIYSYYIGSKEDEITEKYKENSAYFYQSLSLPDVCQKILGDQLDILVFLEIGRVGKMSVLGSLRLAPIQCTTWSHPETSGLHNIDYFLSSDLMEPNNGQEHYSEKLILLPNIGIYYPQPKIPSLPQTRAFFDFQDNEIVYLCCQNIVKYLPQYDYILPEIASKVPNSKFVFLSLPNIELTTKFKERLTLVFNKYSLDIDQYCVFMPSFNHDIYLSLNVACDVFLDTFAWSGGHTTLEALACNLPVVTYPGEFMRGRHSYGILKMLGVEDSIASSEQEYIEIAVRLGVDKRWREEIREKIKANHHNLYEDLECVKGLEKFYLDICNKECNK